MHLFCEILIFLMIQNTLQCAEKVTTHQLLSGGGHIETYFLMKMNRNRDFIFYFKGGGGSIKMGLAAKVPLVHITAG